MSASQHPPLEEVRPNRVEIATPSGALAVVSLVGEHGLAEYEQLKQALDLAAARRRNLIVNLLPCEFIGSTVAGLLLHARDEVVSDGGRFALIVPREGPVRRVAELVRFDTLLLFGAHESLEAVLACMSISTAPSRATGECPAARRT
jgi:anti-anti-sigma factor